MIWSKILIALLFTGIGSKGKLTDEWNLYNVKGKVKTLTEITIGLSENTGAAAVKGKDSLDQIVVSYDQYGRIVSISGSKQNTVIKYDLAGHFIEEDNSSQGTTSMTMHDYDKNGNRIKDYSCLRHDDCEDQTTYKYDPSHRLIRQDYLKPFNSHAPDYSTYEYANDGEVKQVDYLRSGQVVFTKTTQCDTGGRPIKVMGAKPGERLRLLMSSQYDKSGNQTESIYYHVNDKRSRTVYVYDVNNRLISDTIYNGAKSVSYSVYKYDKQGNWIERRCFYDRNPAYKVIRNFVYY